mgnify:CR=1 FL=1
MRASLDGLISARASLDGLVIRASIAAVEHAAAVERLAAASAALALAELEVASAEPVAFDVARRLEAKAS